MTHVKDEDEKIKTSQQNKQTKKPNTKQFPPPKKKTKEKQTQHNTKRRGRK